MFDFMAGYVLGTRSMARASLAGHSLSSVPTNRTDQVADVNDRVDRLLLVVEAMWSLLRESGYDDEDLRAAIEQLDRADGVVDGRRRRRPRPCPTCDSMVEPGRASCAICGHPMPHDSGPFAPNG